MRKLVLIGCGQIARRRILPTLAALSEELGLSVGHIVDTLPSDEVSALWGDLVPPSAVYHQIGQDSRELAALLQDSTLSGLPVIVATPTPLHADHLCAALAANCPVGLEKPLASSHRALDQIATCLQTYDERLLFPLGYYLIEKGLPLLALARRGALTPIQLGMLEGVGVSEWAELRDSLGSIVSMTGLLREGPDPRKWVLTDEAGGHTLETFSHLVAMALPWVGSLTLAKAVLATTPLGPERRTENLVFGEFRGPSGEPIAFGCEKWCPPGAEERWVHIQFEHGRAMMDLERERLSIFRNSHEHRVAWVHATMKYEPQLRLFASKLKDLNQPTEYEVARDSALLSLSVRRAGLAAGLKNAKSNWLHDRLAEGSSA